MRRQKCDPHIGQIKIRSHHVRRGQSAHQEHPMLNLVMLALGLGFFALTVGYAYACDRL
jgi:hypothetical protein